MMKVSPPHYTSTFNQIHFILTKRCQLRCLHCAVANGSLPKKSSEINTADCLAIVRFSMKHGATDFVLSGGEPFLRDDVIEIARFILTSGASTCVIATNCLHISDRYIAQLADLQARYSGLQIRISLDGALPRSHDYLRGSGSFNRTLDTADKLIRGGVTIHGINLVLTKTNYLELEPLFSIAQHLGVVDLTLIDLLAIGRATKLGSLVLGYDEWRSVFAFQWSRRQNTNLWINVRGPFDYDLMSRFGLQHAPIAFDTLYVEPNGSFIVCYPRQSQRKNCGTFSDSLEHKWSEANYSMELLGTVYCTKCPYRALCHGVICRSPS